MFMYAKDMGRGTHQGFTLIELLVVIAIIAILAALLFPVFARAKAAAGDAKTISNAKQLGTAMQLYMDDNDDTFPQAADGTPGTALVGGWVYYSTFGNEVAGTFDVSKGSIFSYANSGEIFKSPADRDARQSGNSFAMNGYLTKWSGTGMNPAKNASEIEFSSGTMLLAEEGCGADSLFGYGYTNGTNDGYLNPAVDHFAKTHPGGAAVVFCDSHAKIIQAQDRFVETICGTKSICF